MLICWVCFTLWNKKKIKISLFICKKNLIEKYKEACNCMEWTLFDDFPINLISGMFLLFWGQPLALDSQLYSRNCISQLNSTRCTEPVFVQCFSVCFPIIKFYLIFLLRPAPFLFKLESKHSQRNPYLLTLLMPVLLLCWCCCSSCGCLLVSCNITFH